jgi:hypothetical protein
VCMCLRIGRHLRASEARLCDDRASSALAPSHKCGSALRMVLRSRVCGNDVSPNPSPLPRHPYHLTAWLTCADRELERSAWCRPRRPSRHAYGRPRARTRSCGARAQNSRRLATGSPGHKKPGLLHVCRSPGTRCAALGIGTCDPRLAAESRHGIGCMHRQTFHTSSPFVRAAAESGAFFSWSPKLLPYRWSTCW